MTSRRIRQKRANQTQTFCSIVLTTVWAKRQTADRCFHADKHKHTHTHTKPSHLVQTITLQQIPCVVVSQECTDVLLVAIEDHFLTYTHAHNMHRLLKGRSAIAEVYSHPPFSCTHQRNPQRYPPYKWVVGCTITNPHVQASTTGRMCVALTHIHLHVYTSTCTLLTTLYC